MDFIGAKVDGGGGDYWIRDMQSSSQIVTTNKPTAILLQPERPFCRPTNSVRATEKKLVSRQRRVKTAEVPIMKRSTAF